MQKRRRHKYTPEYRIARAVEDLVAREAEERQAAAFSAGYDTGFAQCLVFLARFFTQNDAARLANHVDFAMEDSAVYNETICMKRNDKEELRNILAAAQLLRRGRGERL